MGAGAEGGGWDACAQSVTLVQETEEHVTALAAKSVKKSSDSDFH